MNSIKLTGYLIMVLIYKRKYINLKMYRILQSISLLITVTLLLDISILAQPEIKVGARQTEAYLPLLKNKKVAIVGNQTSMIGNIHLVDSLLKLGIKVQNVFAPEHGFRGTADAGELVKDGFDVKTGLPILSLHGRKKRKPTAEILKDIDVVIFDIQDVGARFYTYISTMHYVMEACAEQDKLMIILDRPNPNGHYVDGPVLKKGNESFIGLHPVPIVHGMTIGEYAQMINGERWLKNGVQCSLKIIRCENYSHLDYYQLPVRPSPNLPNMSSIYLYPSLCLFEGTNVSVGRGTDYPFQMFGTPDIDKTEFSFVPVSVPGAKNPKNKGITCYGYMLHEFGNDYFRENGKIYLDWIVKVYGLTKDKTQFFRKDGFFRLLTGDVNVRKMIEDGKTSEEIWASFQLEVQQFKSIRSKYLLYEDFE